MSEVVETEQGTFVRDPLRGSWRTATPGERDQIDRGFMGSAWRSFKNNFAAAGEMLQTASGVLGAGAVDPLLAYENLRQGGADMAAIAEDQQTISRFDEGAAITGNVAAFALDPLNFAVPGGLRAGRTVAQRVASRIADDIPIAAGADDVADVARPAVTAGDNIAAEAANTPRGMRFLIDNLFEVGEMTPQQIALAPVGDRIGFSFLPGQRNGNRLYLESLKSHPIAAQAFAPELQANADLGMNLLARALRLEGVNAGNFTQQIKRQARQSIGAEFNNVRNAVEESTEAIAISPDSAALVREVPSTLKPSQRRINLEQMNGQQAFEVRSRLNSRMRELRSNGEGTAANDLEDVIEELDNSILGALPENEATAEAWRQARQRWRVNIAINKPGVIVDGELRMGPLQRNLEKVFSREFGETLVPDEAFRTANPEIADLMDYTRVSRAFASNLPDSGTATRQFSARMLSGDIVGATREIATAQAVRRLIRMTAREAE